MSKADEFIDQLWVHINHWSHKVEHSRKDMCSGLAHSMLCMLDGVDCGFDGDIEDLINEDAQLHEKLYATYADGVSK